MGRDAKNLMTSESQREIIRRLKGLSDNPGASMPPEIVIRNEKGERLGTLDPVTKVMAVGDEPASMLARWRNDHMSCFFTQFKATPERTRNWLNKVVLPDDTRLFFLIRTADDRPVGNFGICHLAQESVEVDNLIKGEPGSGVRLIFYTWLAMIDWLIRFLGVNHLYGHLFSNNAKCDRSTEAIGFRRTASFRLHRENAGGDVQYRIDFDSAPAPGEIGCTRIEMTSSEFRAKHPWLKQVYG